MPKLTTGFTKTSGGGNKNKTGRSDGTGALSGGKGETSTHHVRSSGSKKGKVQKGAPLPNVTQKGFIKNESGKSLPALQDATVSSTGSRVQGPKGGRGN